MFTNNINNIQFAKSYKMLML